MELNSDNRPDNWADRTVDALLHAYLLDGPDYAQQTLDEIVARDKPALIDVIVVKGRFRALITQ